MTTTTTHRLTLNNWGYARPLLRCDYGTCARRAEAIVAARATNVPGGAPATAERRPSCDRHVADMLAYNGLTEVHPL